MALQLLFELFFAIPSILHASVTVTNLTSNGLEVILITDMTTYLNIKFPALFKSGVKKGISIKNSMLTFKVKFKVKFKVTKR